MIQQRKSSVAPESLSRGKSYRDGDVCRLLAADQDHKCYLCECAFQHQFEVDHLKSRNRYPELTYDWQNLFLVCGPCNRKKGDAFDTLPDPLTTPLEKHLHIIPDLENMGSSVQVRLLDSIPGGEQAVELISRIHNGSDPKKGRTYREECFHDLYMREMTRFIKALIDHRKNATAASRHAVVEMLSQNSTFLGSKFSVLRECGMLNDFAEETRWNRQERM